MKPKYDENLIRLMREIQQIASDLPSGKKHQILNRCSKAMIIIKKKSLKTMSAESTCPSEQKKGHVSARQRVFEAMTQGRRISYRDSAELGVGQMHTTICQVRMWIESKSLPWELKSDWAVRNGYDKCKEYWLERRGA